MFYVIECKNDFPPATEYKIIVADKNEDLRSYYRGVTYNEIVQDKSDDTLCFKCCAADPVEAMIKFWEKYMYGG